MRTSQTERASETREDHQETLGDRIFSNHQGQINFYHKEAEQVKENAPAERGRPKSIQVVKVTLVRDRENQYRTKLIEDERDAACVARDFLAGEDREVFLAMCLDRSGRINSINVVAVGSSEATIVHPREVFKPAILSNADNIILVHNHPSGSPAPSDNDKQITHRLSQCGELLGIKVRDHLIIGDGEYSSCGRSGALSDRMRIKWHMNKFSDDVGASESTLDGVKDSWGLRTVIKKYDEAVGILRGSKDRSGDLLQKVKKGEIAEEEYSCYLGEVTEAKRQVDGFEFHTGKLYELFNGAEK